MAQMLEFACPICGSLCQTTDDMLGKQLQCLICTSRIMVPQKFTEADGIDMKFFLEAGVVKQRLNTPPPESSSQTPPK